MFGILEEQSAPRHALMELREDIEKQLNAALLAERQGPLAELNQKISQVESEVGGIATRIEQGRDEIQALFGMIAELPQVCRFDMKRSLTSSRASQSRSFFLRAQRNSSKARNRTNKMWPGKENQQIRGQDDFRTSSIS